ncbi:putative pentatricopeptide repeat-containing protein At1g13630 [Pyrus x bretschneideri]|uniref:putative pentatricopeptide repeat-containing protein At1g13630 n=1 Tax=Pyrus x bretschneideri TaxID=225117 RepID=UPI00202DF7A9|nr:putative pentatricopeptide repeat-containing protein At1g13630 [Pyrus x bretschneideri]
MFKKIIKGNKKPSKSETHDPSSYGYGQPETRNSGAVSANVVVNHASRSGPAASGTNAVGAAGITALPPSGTIEPLPSFRDVPVSDRQTLFLRKLQSDYTTSILIDGPCHQSGLQDAVSFLVDAERTETGPCVVSFNIIMSWSCKLGFVDVAKSFFCMMFKYGLVPDSYSYNILIHGLCVAGSLEQALEFTKDMERHGVQPDTLTYNILCKGFHLLGLMSGTRKVIQQMLVKGLNPDHVTYTIMICGHCHVGNIDEALKLRKEMISRDFQLSVIVYSVLLSGMCKSGRVEETLGLLYSILIQGLCKQRDVQKASEIYRGMYRKRIIPNYSANRGILLRLREKGDIYEARKYFDHLTTRKYNIMMDGYVKLGSVAEAIKLYKQIIEKGINPSTVTFNTLIHGFCKIGKLVEARRMLDTIELHGLLPSPVTYNTLMNANCEHDRGMLELLQDMEAKAVEPTHVSYTVVIKGLCKQGKLWDAVHLVEKMYAKGLTPDQITYNAIIKCFCKAQDFEKAFQLHNEMLIHDLEPTPVTYNLCVYGDLEDADRLKAEIIKAKQKAENRKENNTIPW